MCKARDVVYKVSCGGCGASYIGETARSVEERYREHSDKYDRDMGQDVSSRKENTGPFAAHGHEKHDGVKQELNHEILAMCPDDTMKLQVTEAVYIQEQNPELNRKEEWGITNVSRRKRDNE